MAKMKPLSPLLLWLLLLLLNLLPLPLKAQPKMSSFVRQIALGQRYERQMSQAVQPRPRWLTAFVRTDDGSRTLEATGCRVLASFGNIHIASIPLAQLDRLSLSAHVSRIEASPRATALMDSMAVHLDATPVYSGTGLPQAFTGRGVVVGVQDIGFDLTHPNFFSADGSSYRIRAFWDQLAAPSADSTLYVGADFTTEDALLGYAHSRDGIEQTHGTHTLGIAAGSGASTPYRGMAWDSDICLVSNASAEDIALIDSADLYKYTSATDALGFKYIFDYAASAGKPCVVSFSEGSHQDLRGDDCLYYAVLDSLVGPGRILVASAGNEGYVRCYIHKPAGRQSAGAFVFNNSGRGYYTIDADAPFSLRLVAYGDRNDTLMVYSRDVFSSPDSVLSDTITAGGDKFTLSLSGWPSPYDANRQAFELLLGCGGRLGYTRPVSLELIGSEADLQLYTLSGRLGDHPDINPALADGEPTHNVLSPGSAPAVICVGATSYRTQFTNWQGAVVTNNSGIDGQRGGYSSVGPTYDGRVKPDVMAPGTNILSSYSSYYLKSHSDSAATTDDVAFTTFRGRTYPWGSNGGTSMSAPAVAGVIALWLEACPSLTTEQCLDVISRTSSHYDPSLTYPNNYYGYGQIDAYRGLLEVLGITQSLSDFPTAHPAGISFGLVGRQLSVSLGGALECPLQLDFYSVSGQKIKSVTLSPGSQRYTVDLGSMPRGIVAVRADGGQPWLRGSLLLRL